MKDIIVSEREREIVVTFVGCNCKMEFWRSMFAAGKMNVTVKYCSRYPECKVTLTEAFDVARKKLLAEASEAVLVISDDEADEILNSMDFTGCL